MYKRQLPALFRSFRLCRRLRRRSSAAHLSSASIAIKSSPWGAAPCEASAVRTASTTRQKRYWKQQAAPQRRRKEGVTESKGGCTRSEEKNARGEHKTKKRQKTQTQNKKETKNTNTKTQKMRSRKKQRRKREITKLWGQNEGRRAESFINDPRAGKGSKWEPRVDFGNGKVHRKRNSPPTVRTVWVYVLLQGSHPFAWLGPSPLLLPSGGVSWAAHLPPANTT